MGHSRLRWSRPRLVHVRFTSDSDRQPSKRDPSLRAMCGRLRVGKGFLHEAVLVGAAMCSASISAVHVTAGHNALRGSGPGQQLAFDHAVALVGCPDRRIDRLCITCCSPSQPSHHAECSARSCSSRKRGWFFITFTPGHHRPRHSGDLVGERDRCDLGGSPRQQSCKPGPILAPWILA